MLQDLLAVSFKQQGGHTQAVGVEPFELVIKDMDSFFIKKKKTRGKQLVLFICNSYFFYLGDVKFLQPIQKGCENWRYLRLQGMTCENIK